MRSRTNSSTSSLTSTSSIRAAGPSARQIAVGVDRRVARRARSHPSRIGKVAQARTTAAGKKAAGDQCEQEQIQSAIFFGRLSAANIQTLVRQSEHRERKKRTPTELGKSPLYRIWQDDKFVTFTNLSISTIKADAARNAFGTREKISCGRSWIPGSTPSHPHFAKHGNLKLSDPVAHRDFTRDSAERCGTRGERLHGQERTRNPRRRHHRRRVSGRERKEDRRNRSAPRRKSAPLCRRGRRTFRMSGMAPQCKLLSLKVLDEAARARQQHDRGARIYPGAQWAVAGVSASTAST